MRFDEDELQLRRADAGLYTLQRVELDPATKKTLLDEVMRRMAEYVSARAPPADLPREAQRDYRAAVRDQSEFTCHEDPENKRLCGGWCRAVQRKEV